MSKEKRIIIIGGAGHVGAPLGVALANEGFKVTLLDLNINNLNKLKLTNSSEFAGISYFE